MNQKSRKHIRISNWAPEDRPREKLLARGSRFLTDAELLAIVLGSGSRDQSALSLSQTILSQYRSDLRLLEETTVAELMRFRGVGLAKAVAICAAMELGKRIQNTTVVQKQVVRDSHTAYTLLRSKIGKLPHEEFWILFLNNANAVIHLMQLSKGGITGTVVDIRLVLKKALECGAVSLIVAHNHPSDQMKPSRADIALTHKLAKAARSLDIKLLDHLIITETSYFSFADEKLI